VFLKITLLVLFAIISHPSFVLAAETLTFDLGEIVVTKDSETIL